MSTRNYIRAPSIYRVLITVYMESAKNSAFFIYYLSTFFNYQSTTYLVQKLLQSLFFHCKNCFVRYLTRGFPPREVKDPPELAINVCKTGRPTYTTRRRNTTYNTQVIILLLLCRPLLLEPDKKNYLYSCHQLQHCNN